MKRPGIGHNGGPKSEPFGLRAAWLRFADQVELRRLAKLHMRIERKKLAMKELVKGTMDYFQLIGIFGSTALIAALLLGFCVYWFKQEKVLFR